VIKSCIETLTLTETLQKEEIKLHKDFKDIFQPIPHIDKLPTNFMAEIKLLDPKKMVKNCSYPCPCKYCEAWHMLLNQHLAAGCIHPSFSPYATPAFIVPKADPSAFPCWVNNYRQLNLNTGRFPPTTLNQ
jgi:hypothetical protein